MVSRSKFQRKRGKSLLDLDILSEKYNIKARHLLIPLILVIFFLFNRRYFVFGILTLFSGVFSFYHDKYNRGPIDFKMPLFLGIFITRHYGLLFTAIFYIVGDVIPTIIAGGRIEGVSILFLGWQLIVNAMVLLFPNIDIITLGITLVIVETIGSTLIKFFTGFPGIVAFISSILSVLTRIIYFLTLGEILEFLLKYV